MTFHNNRISIDSRLKKHDEQPTRSGVNCKLLETSIFFVIFLINLVLLNLLRCFISDVACQNLLLHSVLDDFKLNNLFLRILDDVNEHLT